MVTQLQLFSHPANKKANLHIKTQYPTPGYIHQVRQNIKLTKMGLPQHNTTTPSSEAQKTTTTTTQNTSQEHPYDATTRASGAGVNTGAGVTREKTEAEKEADRLYEERMEEEYAKREGGS
jgi:hypothetical protein